MPRPPLDRRASCARTGRAHGRADSFSSVLSRSCGSAAGWPAAGSDDGWRLRLRCVSCAAVGGSPSCLTLATEAAVPAGEGPCGGASPGVVGDKCDAQHPMSFVCVWDLPKASSKKGMCVFLHPHNATHTQQARREGGPHNTHYTHPGTCTSSEARRRCHTSRHTTHTQTLFYQPTTSSGGEERLEEGAGGRGEHGGGHKHGRRRGRGRRTFTA